MSRLYEKSGVSLDSGYESVRRIKKHVDRTKRLGVIGNIGSFGGMFDLSKLNYKEPVLVSGTDGVGTKLLIAIEMDKHDTIGQDVVAMCVNDVLSNGAEPLYFLDYIAVGKNKPSQIEQIVKGIADGCEIAGCALIGGETAEMPDMYSKSHYDIAGFTVGAVEKSKLIDNTNVEVDDVLIGIESSGVHSNGFSLIRKIIRDSNLDLFTYYDELNSTLGDALLTPTKIYVKPVLDLLTKFNIKSIVHITGGGFDENIPRGLNKGQGVYIDSYEVPAIFRFLENKGKIDHREMFNIFNMGVGMVLIVNKNEAKDVITELKNHNLKSIELGRVTSEEGVVIK